MITQLDEFITRHHLIPENKTIVIGLSGGPDSIFLLHFLAQLTSHKPLTLITAHLDHEWRKDSANDVLFCKEIAHSYGIPFVAGKASELIHAIKPNGSQEEIGRKLRHLFLEATAQQYGAGAIALGHHAQDQEETFFIRLIRGTTLSGLIGIRPKQGLYIRPLLELNKPEIIRYLQEHSIDYLIDPTNESESYLRNRIRRNVLPTLHEVDNRFDANFLRTIHHLQAAELFLEKTTSEHFELISSSVQGKRTIDLTTFFALDPYLQKRILIHWLITESVPFVPTSSFFDEIMRFLNTNKSGEHTMHTTWALVKKESNLWIKQL
jgi:tRNA(Ile)-lysidine synthase